MDLKPGMHCKACDKLMAKNSIDCELCNKCMEAVMDYNSDLIDKLTSAEMADWVLDEKEKTGV